MQRERQAFHVSALTNMAAGKRGVLSQSCNDAFRQIGESFKTNCQTENCFASLYGYIVRDNTGHINYYGMLRCKR